MPDELNQEDTMQLTKSERVAELRAYSLLYGLEKLASLGKGFILYQNPDNRWSAFLSAGGTEHRATGWDSPATAISALCDAVEGRWMKPAESGVATATFGVAGTKQEEFAIVGYTARIPGKSSIKIAGAIVPMVVSRLIVFCIHHTDTARLLLPILDQIIKDSEGSAKNDGGPIP